MFDVVSPLLARDYRFFDAARKAAGDSDFKVHVGAVACYKGKVVASASSTNKTHPMQYTYNKYRGDFKQVGTCLPKAHAEIRLISKLKKLDIPMKDVSVYVYRACKSRAFGIARPCAACRKALIEIGIRRFYYTTDEGYCLEVINQKEGV